MSLAQRFLKKIPQYTRSRRHLQAVVKHGNPRKWANIARVEWERKRHAVEVNGSPYILIIDPCNVCNLRCPLCPTGLENLGRDQTMMSLDCFKRYFDPFAPHLFEAYMHNWGESLLNKQVYKMIAHAQSMNVGTNLSSNFNRVSTDDMDNLIDSGLEYLIISLDGTSQDVYKQYRVRGDYDTVMANLAELIRRRNLRKSKTPFIEWQFIVMKQNEHQIQEAEMLAKKVGVDLMRFIPVGMPIETVDRKATAEKWFPRNIEGREQRGDNQKTYGITAKPAPCFYLYRSVVINPDGGVSPCCEVYRGEWDFDDLSKTDQIDVHKFYNSPKYQSARSLFTTRTDVKHVRTVCDGCDIFERPACKPVVRDSQPASGAVVPLSISAARPAALTRETQAK